MIALYKPNSKNTGNAFSFKLSSNRSSDPCIYINAVQQHSWNSETKNGSFSQNAKNPEKSIAIKLNEFELGGLIAAIEKEIEFSVFHTFDENKTTISFKPYIKQNGGKAFSLSVVRNSALKFGIGIEVGEAYALREFFKKSLNDIYSARQSFGE